MKQLICGNCGYLTNKNGAEEIGSTVYVIIKTIILVAAFIGLLFLGPVGWILAIALLFIPISKKKTNQCPKCKGENCLIPIDTPKGQELYNKYLN